MDIFTTVPLIYGKGLNVWLGIVLLVQLTFQITIGIAMTRGFNDLRYHKINAALIGVIAFVHTYYGIGVWFFNFKYGR